MLKENEQCINVRKTVICELPTTPKVDGRESSIMCCGFCDVTQVKVRYDYHIAAQPVWKLVWHN